MPPEPEPARRPHDFQAEPSAERQDRAEAESLRRAHQRLLSALNHQIRTPLSGIMGMLELMQEEALPPRLADMVEAAVHSSRGLLTFVEELADYTRIQSGPLTLRRQPVDVRHILRSVATTFEPVARAQGLSLELELATGLPPAMWSDGPRLEQILNGLVSNAVKFTVEGSVRLSAAVEDEQLVLEVHDSGFGIPEDAREAIFEPFVEAPEGRPRPFGGTGLGLATVRGIVTAMGGRVELHSEEGVGSVFTVRLPVSRAPRAPRPASPLPSNPSQWKVLLVEDNPINRKVACAMLDRLGHRVRAAADGIEALELMARNRFDVVLMDLHMPRLGGIDCTRQIRRTLPQPPPIIALTATVSDEERAACLESGMADFLAKPVDLDTLRRTLARHVTRTTIA
jgi:CheY-like chemotaxis protein/two-component sensor histidine kinase